MFGKVVDVEWTKRDRYKRVVGKVLIDGRDINFAQVQAGMAWWYEAYKKEQSPGDRIAYEEAQSQARVKRIGLWADKEPVPPWEWRLTKKAQGRTR